MSQNGYTCYSPTTMGSSGTFLSTDNHLLPRELKKVKNQIKVNEKNNINTLNSKTFRRLNFPTKKYQTRHLGTKQNVVKFSFFKFKFGAMKQGQILFTTASAAL